MNWMLVAFIVILIALSGCTEANSKTDEWEGWTLAASQLAKHHDEKEGVVCYLSTRVPMGYSSYTLSCVKL